MLAHHECLWAQELDAACVQRPDAHAYRRGSVLAADLIGQPHAAPRGEQHAGDAGEEVAPREQQTSDETAGDNHRRADGDGENDGGEDDGKRGRLSDVAEEVHGYIPLMLCFYGMCRREKKCLVG